MRRAQDDALAAYGQAQEHRDYAKTAPINQPSTAPMSKPKSKWFRVATEGATTDGREITRAEIEQMAKNYDPAKYGARIWLEHYRGTVPGGPFDALGDVLAVEARDVEDGKRALFAQIEPLPALIEMNKKGQKLYSSVEIHPSFPTTGGGAYLYGLGVTDSPASLGTEVLKFAAGAKENPFAARKGDKAVVFSAAQEFTLEFETPAPDADTGVVATALAKFAAIMEKLVGSEPPKPEIKNHSQNDTSAAVLAAVKEAGTAMQAFATQQAKDAQTIAGLQGQYSSLQKAHDELVKKLNAEPEGVQRPPATGGNGQELAEF